MPTIEPTTDPDGWEPVPDLEPMLEVLELDDLDVLAEATHPTRGALLRRFRSPRTVAAVAALMDVPVTRLYHHVNKLESAGLLRVVATRRVGAVTERRYQGTARSFRLAPHLYTELDGRELATAMGAVFDVAKLGLQRTIEADEWRRSEPDEHSVLSLGQVHLSEAGRRDLLRRLTEVVESVQSDRTDDDPDATAITVLIAAFPDTR